MSRRRMIYEGKAKILYEGPEPHLLIQYFKDDATAFNAEKKAVLDGKGVLNNRISEYVMTRLGEIGIPHHFVKRLNMREQLIKKVEIIPLEVIVRNVAAGTMAKRLGEEHISAFGWATQAEMDDMVSLALRINDYMCGLFAAVGIRLVDFKLEFGRLFEKDMVRTVLADEISPDSCRLWDMETNKKLDKDRFRRDLGDVTEAYSEVARRTGIISDSGEGANVVDITGGAK